MKNETKKKDKLKLTKDLTQEAKKILNTAKVTSLAMCLIFVPFTLIVIPFKSVAIIGTIYFCLFVITELFRALIYTIQASTYSILSHMSESEKKEKE